MGIEYDPVVVHITSKSEFLTFSEVGALLMSHEGRLESHNLIGVSSPTANTTTPPQQRKIDNPSFSRQSFSSFQRGRGRGRFGRGGGRRPWHTNGKPTCQSCGIHGQVAEICYYRFDKDLFLLSVHQYLLVHLLKNLVDHLTLIQQLPSLQLNLNHHLKNGGFQTQVHLIMLLMISPTSLLAASILVVVKFTWKMVQVCPYLTLENPDCTLLLPLKLFF